jgi:putative ABC transport system permease protein
MRGFAQWYALCKFRQKLNLMIRNYFVLFIRNLKRQKLFSTINLLGLTVSIASTLLIYLYVRHELSYDRFHPDVDRIYRINQTFIWGENNNSQFASTGPGVAYAVREEIAEVELMTSIHTPGDFIISYANPAKEVIAFEETRVFAADTNFFKMFHFPFVKGDAESAFRQANTLVMTRSTAKKYFRNEDPIGKMVRLGGLNGEDQKTYEVTGVVEDAPDNSYIKFDVLLSMKGYPIERLSWSWIWTQLETYVRLHPEANVENVRQKLSAIPRKHAEQTLQRAFNTTFDDYIKSGKKWELFLQPMTGIHLPDEPVLNRLSDSGNIKVIYSFIAAAIFIVILSCVNFMNLSTAQFTRRIKEASVRKILGLGKKHLSLGYFFEALAFCLIAMVFGICVTQIFLPGFNLITEKNLQLNLFNDPGLVAGIFTIIFVMAVISSSYPALFLSGFHPVEAMKGKLKVGREGKSFRNSLVVFQFSISIVLIICTAVVFQQLNFVSEKDLGFNQENLLVLNHVEAVRDGEAIASSVEKIKGVESVSWCRSVPPSIWGGDTFTAEGLNSKTFPLNYTSADYNYIPTLDIKIKLGRNFSENNPADGKGVIVNEAAIKKIGWNLDESVIGKKLMYPGSNEGYEIVGVVSDFNYWSLTNPIEPFAIFHVTNSDVNAGNRQYLVLRVNSQSPVEWNSTIASLNEVWRTHAGDSPFQYTFVDQSFADTFKSQQQFGTVLTVMASLAIIIAALGLLGMIVYALEQRTKEIGIRKISGASVWNILVLISNAYTKLVVTAFVLAAPVSYWLMQQWLKDFAYKITPSMWIYIATGVGVLIISILITSYHSMRAALSNPVDVLKDE